MPDPSTELRALSPDLGWPQTPDLAAAVLAALPREDAPARVTGRRPRRRRRRLVVAVLIAILAPPAAALAVPGSRHAILDALGLRHVTIEQRITLPPSARDPRLGVRTTLARAARAAGFTPLQAATLGPAEAVHQRDGIVTLTYRNGRILLAQARGTLDRAVLHKVVVVDARSRSTTVNGAPALWLGRDHVYEWFDATGPLLRSGPALIWETGGLVLRLEGPRTEAEARRIAAGAR
jgi:hypothetical protein